MSPQKLFSFSSCLSFCLDFSVMYQKAIYKTRNTGTGNGIRGMRGMSIPGNAQEDSGECSRRFQGMLSKIPGNAQEDSGECSTRFRGMFKKIPGNVRKDSGEYSKRFRGMFQKIPGNLNLDLFCEILLIFYQILQLNGVKTKEYFLYYYLLLITNPLRLDTVFLPPFSFLFSFSCRGKGVITMHRCRGIKKL